MITIAQEDAAMAQLPSELTGGLREMIRRVRGIVLLRGVLTTVAVLFGCSLVIMAIDAGVMINSAPVRWILSLTALAVVLATAWTSLIRPLLQPLSLTRMARVLETRHPELQERISSVIELLAMGGAAGSEGSKQLIELLARDAQTDMRGVRARSEFTGRSLKPALMSTLVIAGVFTGLFLVWPRQTTLLFTRAVAPFANLADLQGAGLKVEPGDVIRVEGGELTLRLLADRAGPGRAELQIELEAGGKATERMQQVSSEDEEPTVYEWHDPSVTRSFRYRMRYGSGLTRFYTVTVVPPPTVTRMVITCAYPAYTERDDYVLPESMREIVGVAGGSVTIETDFNREAEGILLLGDREVRGTSGETPGSTWTFNLATNLPTTWGLLLRDRNGFTNAVEWASLKVLSDRPPVVDLRSPRASKLTLPPYGVLDLACLIHEDFGLSESKLIIDPQGFNTTPQIRPLELTPGAEEYWSGRSQLELGLLDLRGSRQFMAWIGVRDTRPAELGGPQEALSRKVEITISETAKRLEDQLRAEHREDMIAMLKNASELLTKAAGEVEIVQDRLVVELLPPPIVKALTTAQDQSAEAVDVLKSAAEVASGSAFTLMDRRILWVVDELAQPAHAETASISVVDPSKRREQASTAMTSLRRAAAKILELIKLIEEMEKKLAEIAAVKALTDRETTLAKLAKEDMTPEEIKAWKKEQEKVAAALAEQKNLNPEEAKAAQKQIDEAQKAMLEQEQKQAEQQKADEQKKSDPSDPKQQSGDEKKPDAKDSKPKDDKAKDGKAKDSKGKKSKPTKGKGKGQGKTGKPGKGKDTKGKDGKDKGKTGKGGKGPGKPDPSPSKPSQEAAKAAEMMKKMAEAMEEQMMAKMPPSKKTPKSGSKPTKGGNSRGKGKPGAYVAGSFQTGVPNADWARIKGESGAGALADELQNVPPEYRDLVRRYFVELAEEGEKKKGEPR